MACCRFGSSCGCGDKEDRLKPAKICLFYKAVKHTDEQEDVRFVYQLLQPFYTTSQPFYINLTSHLKISSIQKLQISSRNI